ncbi:MAG: hypothetical protein P8P48_12710 [Saprospiraceae bacterium]|jgi:hypothetical protein|nr:hypothetical protein [Saprospiraceae bacterium]
MELLLKILIGLLFLGLLVMNFYFRRKVTKSYRILVKNNVEFDSKHIFNKKKLEEEIIPKYPKEEADIRQFVNLLNQSIKIGFGLLVLITVFGGILLWDSFYNI